MRIVAAVFVFALLVCASTRPPFRPAGVGGLGRIGVSMALASTPPNDLPLVIGGNAECWGDDTRQDITCKALTETFLLDMRGATHRVVFDAMKVRGRILSRRDALEELRFISNFSMGQKTGSGSINFVFDEAGRVFSIHGELDPPNMVGKFAIFIWNARFVPAPCSDIPGTWLRACSTRDLENEWRTE